MAVEDLPKPVPKMIKKEASVQGRPTGNDSESDDEDPVKKLEDQITNEKLKKLEKIFEEADEDGGGGLDMDEFRNAMRGAMGENLTDTELDMLFMKVDTNCDGTVDWDEYLSYMLLEYRGKDDMNIHHMNKPFPKKPYIVPHMQRYQRHHDSIIKIIYQPNIMKHHNSLFQIAEDGMGRYMTVTKGGIVNIWSYELKHLRAHKIEQPKASMMKNLGVWVTDAVYMANVNMVAVSMTTGTIVFYDLTANAFQLILTITDMDICVTCMDYWFHPDDSSQALLLWGDARGTVATLCFEGCPSICFFQYTSKSFKSTMSFKDLQLGETCGVKGYKLQNIHEDFVLKIKYFPQINFFMSCCRSRNSSLYVGDVQGKRQTIFKVSKGVFDFDFCKKNNVIVTGGKDTVVRVWNPYVPSKPVMILQGHKSPVTYVEIIETREQVITISEDKDIHVFDLNTQTCIQSIYRKFVPMGPRPISAMYFNPHRTAMVLGTNQLAMFERKEVEFFAEHLTSYDVPVNKIIYNRLFNQLVSGGADSLVCVWDVDSGERVIQFSAVKIPDKAALEEPPSEITVMKFDPTFRRLITGTRDGCVKIWNFNNGACLKELETFDDFEVTGIVCPSHRILTGGWSQVIRTYMDTKDEEEDETVVQWRHHHKDDITAMAFCPPSTVVSGSYDGDILIWSLETRQVTLRLNAHVSNQPVTVLGNKVKKPMKTPSKAPSADDGSTTIHIPKFGTSTGTGDAPSISLGIPPTQKGRPSFFQSQVANVTITSEDSPRSSDKKSHESSFGSSDALRSDNSGVPKEADSGSTKEFDLSTWMAYNVKRASIAAPIPAATNRRLSVLAPLKASARLPMRRGGTMHLSKDSDMAAESDAMKALLNIKMKIAESAEDSDNENNNNNSYRNSNNNASLSSVASTGRYSQYRLGGERSVVLPDIGRKPVKLICDTPRALDLSPKSDEQDLDSSFADKSEWDSSFDDKSDDEENSTFNDSTNFTNVSSTFDDGRACDLRNDDSDDKSDDERYSYTETDVEDDDADAGNENDNNNYNRLLIDNENNNNRQIDEQVDSKAPVSLTMQPDVRRDSLRRYDKNRRTSWKKPTERRKGSVESRTGFRRSIINSLGLLGGDIYRQTNTVQIRKKYDEYLAKNEASVEHLLFLEARVSDPQTAILVAGCAQAWVRFWSIDHRGGLLGQFNVAHKAGDNCGAIATDDENSVLITGDANGYIKVWDISEYCLNPVCYPQSAYDRRLKTERNSQYPFMRESDRLRRQAGTQARYNPPPQSTRPDATWKAPPLLSSCRGHLKGITDIAFVVGQNKFCTSSLDHSIRMWTLQGEFLGIFGQGLPWNGPPESEHLKQSTGSDEEESLIAKPKRKIEFKTSRKLPEDVRRVASATTLRVLYGGPRPHWKLAKNIIMVWVPLLRAARLKAEELRDLDQIKVEQVASEDLSKEFVMKSEILGKNFKSGRKHQKLPQMSKIRQFNHQCDVYASIPYHELAAVDETLKPPQTILEIQERQRNLLNIRTKTRTKAAVTNIIKRNLATKLFRPGPSSSVASTTTGPVSSVLAGLRGGVKRTSIPNNRNEGSRAKPSSSKTSTQPLPSRYSSRDMGGSRKLLPSISQKT